MFDLNSHSFRMRIVRGEIMSRHNRQQPEYQALFLESNHDLYSLPPVFLDTSDSDFTEEMVLWFDDQLATNLVPHRSMVFDNDSNGKLSHGFVAVRPDLPESVRSLSAMVMFFRECLSDPALSAIRTA